MMPPRPLDAGCFNRRAAVGRRSALGFGSLGLTVDNRRQFGLDFLNRAAKLIASDRGKPPRQDRKPGIFPGLFHPFTSQPHDLLAAASGKGGAVSPGGNGAFKAGRLGRGEHCGR